MKYLAILFAALIARFKNLAFRHQNRLCYLIGTWKKENGDVAYAFLYTRPRLEIVVCVASVELGHDVLRDLQFNTSYVRFPIGNGKWDMLAFRNC